MLDNSLSLTGLLLAGDVDSVDGSANCPVGYEAGAFVNCGADFIHSPAVSKHHPTSIPKWTGPSLTIEDWREIVRSKIEIISFEQALDNVHPFLGSSEDIGLLTKNNLLSLLK